MTITPRPKGEREDAPIAELVPWLLPISNGVVACKDSGLLAAYRIDGIDWANADEAEIDALLTRLQSAISSLQHDPVAIWSLLVRFAHDDYPQPTFDNPVALRIDELHHEYIRSVAGQQIGLYVVFYLGPTRGVSRFMDRVQSLVRQGESLPYAVWFATRALINSKFAFAYTAHELYGVLARFESLLDSFISRVTELSWHRLEEDDLIGFLCSFVSDSNTPMTPVPAHGDTFLDTLLPDAELEDHNGVLRLGDQWIGVLSIKEWPQMTSPSLLLMALSVNAPVCISSVFRLYTPEASEKLISRMKSYLDVSSYRLKDYVKAAFSSQGLDPSKEDGAKADMRDSLREAQAMVSSGIGWGMMNVTITIAGRSEKEARELTDLLRKRLLTVCPGVIWERLHALDAWATQLPGQLDRSKRWLFMHAGNFADSMLLYTVNTGSKVNRYLTEQTGRHCPALTLLATQDHIPYHFNFHVGALAHTMTIGPSRSGKSVFINFLISQWLRYVPCRVIIFDKDYSCKITTLLHSGTHFDLTRSKVPLNPFSLVTDKTHWEFLTGWVVNLLESRGFQASAEDETAVREAITQMAADPATEHHRLGALRALLPPRLHALLDPWIDDGNYASYFDNDRDEFGLETISCFEMGEIMRIPHVARLFLDYTFYRITRLLQQNRERGHDVVPTMIYLEECWFLFENPVFAERLRDWLKTFAKLNAFVVMSTQSLEDMVTSDRKVFASIRDNIPTRIFLPNPKARTDSLRHLYVREFGLPERLIDAIAFAVPRQDYLIITDEGEQMTSCSFDSEQLAYLRSDSFALSVFDEEYAQGPGWDQRYLRRMLQTEGL